MAGTRNLTEGNPAKLILLFTVPLLIGNIFQQFYNIADTFIVGRTIGINALAAVGCTGSIMFLIVGFAQGLTAGLTIITAQKFGADDKQGVKESYFVGILISLILTIILTTISTIFARPILELMNTPAEIIDDAYNFVFIIFLGIIASMFFNFFSNIIRALGDSRTPLVYLVVACILNIILEFGFILIFKMGVRGAALATVIAQGVSALLCIWYIKRNLPVLKLTKSDLKISKDVFIEHVRMALPMGFQASIIAIGAIIVQFALNSLGAVSVAAYTAAQKIDTIAIQPMMSFGITMATYTAQNYGAGKIERIKEGVRKCILISMSFSIIVGLTNTLGGHFFTAIFVGYDQKEVISLSQLYLTSNGLCYFILSLLFIYRYTLQGLGQSFIPTVAGIMELLMRTFAAIELSKPLGFLGVSLSNPLAWFGACIPLISAYYITIKKVSNEHLEKEHYENDNETGTCSCVNK
ncbi:MATE family efflux transporter [Clostridium saccharobutylicum]|uniref:Putative efflux protein, MATE family n=1 Tax=Clostridium saccharobutylicum DSM 13864 TaxID=1345695 RepID=U5MQR3_CLOSA|nr:MATE family efflux transporter [Clostridium saccharobutylicum]AGX43144.1 putative efflux protein, MATE family [Clostridium saccharobutylicum DSM 13864]AQR90441.1 multidrug export protein MepA [Clostridium saccharobutylicum]AQS00347.1 multidrug export protein MepA [Clostridium saccharobutylicum]AQS14330.1 multidrug export protein MepA [Clostridium saccharobutylicum]MBA2906612.1 putative MATE family efflux protein [Clostridium saccharobutylicum]